MSEQQPAVFLCQVGELTAQSRRDLRKAGIVVAEVQSLANCQFIKPSEAVSSGDLFWAVLDALNLKGAYGSTGEKQREKLAENLLGVVLERRGFEKVKP